MDDRTGCDAPYLAIVPVSRSRATTRAVVWLVPAAILGVGAISIYRGVHFVPSGISNRFVDYAIALIALPVPAGALWTAWNALRWLLLALWPARVGVFASDAELTMRLGPFGTAVFEVERLEVRYAYECSGEEDDEAGFEAFIPEDEQHATLLPRITHPKAKAALNRVILRFAQGDEAETARRLRPAIERWRTMQARPRTQ